MNPDSTEQEPTPNPPQKSRSILYGALLVMGASAAYAIFRPLPVPDAPTLGTSPSTQSTPASPTSTAARQAKPELSIFVPDDNGQLQKRVVPLDPRKMGGTKGDPADVLATTAVRELMKATPETFPTGAKLVGEVSSKGDVPTLNFNRAFVDESFWQGSARTTAALDSLALTVSEARKLALGSSGGDTVRIVAEGKPITSLGEMDLREPYSATTKAPAGSEP